MEKLKIARRNRKGNLTRALKELQFLIDGDATATEIEVGITKAKSRFDQVEKCHEELVELITEEEDFAKEQDWMTDTQDEFLKEMIRIKKLLTSTGTECPVEIGQNADAENTQNSTESSNANVVEMEADGGSGEVTTTGTSANDTVASESSNNANDPETTNKNGNSNLEGLLKTMSLPKPQPKPFEGDPLHYHAFISTFKNMVAGISDDNLKLNTLMSLCSGKALTAIQYCVLKSPGEGLKAALKTLAERFGNVAVVVQAWVSKVTSCAKVDTGKLNAYADDLNNCYEALSSLGYLNELNNQGALKQIVGKLPKFLQNRWQRENYKLKSKGQVPGLAEVVKFTKAAAMEIEDPVFGSLENGKYPTKPTRNQVNNVGFSQQQGLPQNDRKHYAKCWLCKTMDHWPDQCTKLIEMQAGARLEAAKQNHVCFSCLKVAGRNHRMNNCSRKKVCGIKDGDGECNRTHHKLLHTGMPIKGVTVNQAGMSGFGETLLNVLDVEVRSKIGNMHTARVMLDSGSEGTFVREGFAKKLDLKGRGVSASITMLGGAVETFDSHVYDLYLKGTQPTMLHKITALGIDRLNSVGSVDIEKIERMFHMNNNTLQRSSGNIDILIGVDHADLLCGETLKSGGLIAQKSPLGWSVFGGHSTDQKGRKVLNVQICKPVELTDFWTTEAMGVDVSNDHKAINICESEEAEMIESSCRKVGNRWLVPYPWAKDPVNLADNKGQAVKMLKGLENRLSKSPYADAYQSQIEEMVDLGFARKLNQAEIENYKGPVHYIPHHAVVRPEKKSTPVRIVFNSSNRYNGESINDYWFKGPDLLNNLHGVVLRFRQNPVAICGDIAKMYHQVLITELDQHVHRFLWRDMDDTKRPDTFIKTVLTFGDKPAPAMALTALKMTAKENAKQHPRVAEVIDKDTYMDDVCTSVATVKEAAELTQSLDAVLETGGFKIKHWLSNKELPGSSTSEEESKLLGNTDGGEKVLGVKWNHQEDIVEVNVKVNEKMRGSITKRKALGVIAQIYDPIGFVAPIIVKLKMKMQELWEAGVDWDDELPQQTQEEWKQLFQELESINRVSIERCLTPPNASEDVSLIVFCDASEKAFGACAYLRWRLNDDSFETRFVAAKSRVAPLKKLTVPRLELQAAVMAARLGLSIMEEMTLPCPRRMFLTDSMIVLGWIRKPISRFKQFVAARVQEIQSKTKIDEWSHVPGVSNPADDLSRGVAAEKLDNRFLHGPPFLGLPESEWPSENYKAVTDENEEKQTKTCGHVEVEATSTPIDISECKTWDELRQVYRKKIYDEGSSSLDADKEKEIELRLLRRVQQESFCEEYKLLQKGKTIPGSSRLVNLDPQFDEESALIRVGGRLRRADSLEIDTSPIVLDPGHRITRLLVRRVDHENFKHSAGVEQVFAYIRRRYWILKGRSAIKLELMKCQECQHWRKKPEVPKMADLPECRLRVGKPAFFSTGMDCFGPYTVKIGRRHEKRWGLIFKCMTTKAVHLELVASMDADAFIMAFQRFASRRGVPKELFSDCGTNFIGAERELRECFKDMSEDLQAKLAERQVKFHFNPPCAPHFGGTWEREIRSIKNALKCCLKDRVPPEAVLQTVLVEVEGLINSKPLGYSSSDIVDADAVTPNMLLMGRRDPATPLVTVDPKDELRSKRQWKHTQVIVDIFWKRFMTEYLPTMQARQKWQKDSPSLNLKDKVLVVDSQAPRGEWLVGEVVKVYPSQDRKVRVADVSVNNKVYKRPVVKLIKLEKFDD